MTAIGMAVACWGDYWERYGSSFVDSILAMDPPFDEVVIVSDQKLKVPAEIVHLEPSSEYRQWDWFNQAVDACASEWITVGSVDDPLFPDAIVDLKLTGELIQVACMETDGVSFCPGLNHWERMLDLDEIRVWTACIMRRCLYQRFPWRRVYHPDWMQWLEMRHANIDIRFDRRPRFRHVYHSDSHSNQYSSRGYREIREMKRMLVTGLVVPGIEWPPLGSDWLGQLDPEHVSRSKSAWVDMRLRTGRRIYE